MKRTLAFICFAVIAMSLLLGGCSKKKNDTPREDGFYLKSSAEGGEIIEINFEKKTYEGEGDLRVRSTVGFGHIPGKVGNSSADKDFLMVDYLIIAEPWEADKRPAWEMNTKYETSWSDEKYNSTEKESGEFYPNFKEEVTFTFPEEVTKGYLEIRLYNVDRQNESSANQFASIKVYFERNGGVLTLNP